MVIDFQSELDSIWNTYKEEFRKANNKVKGLVPILEHGYMYSNVSQCDILIVGINPSCRKGEKKLDYNNFIFSNTGGLYFNKFHNILKGVDTQNKFKVDYIDLLNIRVTEQKEINSFLKYNEGVDFICKQLLITQRVIEKIKPKLIVVFNRLAGSLLGANVKLTQGNLTNVWLGYEYYKPENYNCQIISGLINSTERIGALESTELIGTPVYFSKYLGRAKTIEMVDIVNDLKKIVSNHIFLDDKYNGREDLIKNVNSLNTITKLKLEAVKDQRYSDSARLRDREREILKLLNT